MTTFCGVAQNHPSANSLNSADWDSLFPRRAGTYGTHPQGYSSDFYSYNNLMLATRDMSDYRVLIRRKKGVWGQWITVFRKSTGDQYNYSDVSSSWHRDTTPEVIDIVDFAGFLNESSTIDNKRELAAFLANISKETTGGWQLPVGGGAAGDYALWGLYFVHEVGYNKSNGVGTYSQSHAEFPPNPNVGYYGRGPIQLSWNYNYGQFSKFVFNDKSVLLDYPDSLQESGILAFKSAIWFWMMPQFPKPSCHQVMHDQWVHDSAYSASRMYKKGFAHTNNIINGGLECRTTSTSAFTEKVKLRSDLYKYYLSVLSFDSSQIAAEDTGDYSTRCYASSTDAMVDYRDCRLKNSYFGTFAIDTQVSCGPYRWIDGNTYHTDTSLVVYQVPGGDRNNNDSVVILQLQILEPSESVDSQVVCGPFTWMDSLTYRTSTDSAIHVLKGAASNGCDSIIRLHLTVQTASMGIDQQHACGPFRWIDGNIYSADNSTAEYIIPGGASNGCDSMVRLELIIEKVDLGIERTDSSLTALSGEGYYRWGHCENGFLPIAGANQRTLQIRQNGSYALELTANGCTDTSECFIFDRLSSGNSLNGIASHLYPNPASLVVHVVYPGRINKVEWVNAVGQTVATSSHDSRNISLDASVLGTGTYVLKLFTEHGVTFHRILIIR